MTGKTLEEFKKEVQNQSQTRNSRVKNSVGVRQAFLYLQRNKWPGINKPLTEKQFQQIIRKVNEGMARLLIEKKEITFPHRMGTLELRTYSTDAKYKDGKLIVPKLINWDATLKLWYEDSEAYKNRTLVRDTHRTGVRIIYNRTKADYTNKGYFDFILNRDTARTLASMLRTGTLETFAYGTVY